MARYTLDYSAPPPLQRRTRSATHRWPLLVALSGLSLGLMSAIYAYHLRAENQYLRHQRDVLVLRHDSLLAIRRDRFQPLPIDSTERRPRSEKSNPLLIKD
jgi:hypothetical protein